MPYKNDRLKLKLPPSEDRRRCALTNKDRADIKELYSQGWFIRKIARYYEDKCSRRTIIFIIFPERLERMAKQHQLEKHHLKYYNKDKWREQMRKHRAHRAEVFNAGDAPPVWNKLEYGIAYSNLTPHIRIRNIDKIKRTKRAVYSKRYREKQKNLIN